jgi:hypothetical protein
MDAGTLFELTQGLSFFTFYVCFDDRSDGQQEVL